MARHFACRASLSASRSLRLGGRFGLPWVECGDWDPDLLDATFQQLESWDFCHCSNTFAGVWMLQPHMQVWGIACMVV